MKKIIVIALAILVLSGLTSALYITSKSRNFQFFGKIVNQVDTDQKVIALTFDDAPTGHVGDVLNMLQEKDAKATFYVIGRNSENFKDEIKDIVAKGHELGNHSYSHRRMVFKSQEFIRDEIEKTNALIRDAGYVGEITFRPPNGKKLLGLPWYLSKNNIKTIMWNVEPDTYFSGNADAIEKYTVENIKPGSIILMHPFCEDECQADREALPKIINELKMNGYKFVTISQLLEYKNNL